MHDTIERALCARPLPPPAPVWLRFLAVAGGLAAAAATAALIYFLKLSAPDCADRCAEEMVREGFPWTIGLLIWIGVFCWVLGALSAVLGSIATLGFLIERFSADPAWS